MKILHAISTLKTGGAEHLMVDLLPELKKMGNDVELLLINGQRTPFYDELESKGIVIHKIQATGRIYSVFHVFKLKKYLMQFDLIHTHTFPCQLLFALAKRIFRSKISLVTTEHSTTNHRRDKFYLKPLDKFVYKQYQIIICIAEKAKDNLANHLCSENGLVVINNGINYNKFANHVKDVLPARKTITMVASMRDAKDQDTLIKAMTLLNDDFYLRLVGDGPRKGQLKDLAVSLNVNDKVEFLGNQSDIPGILKDSDFVVLSSHWEGLSLSCIEGMASGRPFLASNVPGLEDVVRGYGILFPEGDYKTLANDIQNLSDNYNNYIRVANKCQERAKQFDISIMSKKYNEIYKNIFNK